MPAPRNHGKTWTDEDESLLVSLHQQQGLSHNSIGTYLGRSEYAIRCKLRALGINPYGKPYRRDKEDLDMTTTSTDTFMNLNPCQGVMYTGQPTEPTTGQLQLREVLMDMKKGEVVVVRGIYTGTKYHITKCEPFVGEGVVSMLHPDSGEVYHEKMTEVLNYTELMDFDPTQEYMVSVDGMQAPRKVHDSYKSACDEADRLARKHLGNRVRVLKVEHVIRARQHVEVEECP